MAPGLVRLGALDLALGNGDRLLGAYASGLNVVVRADLSTAAGSCQIEVSTNYLGPLQSTPSVDPDGTIRVRPVDAGDPGAPNATEAGRAAGSIECTDPGDVDRVVNRLVGGQT